MKTSMHTMVLVAGLMLGQTGCQTQQKIARNQVAAQEWLDQHHGTAGIQVSGNWFAESWGRANFKQSGSKVTGTLDTYEIKGVVSANKVYLTAWDSGKCYYAIVLAGAGRNSLKGSYTDGPSYIEKADQQRTIELRRSY